MTQHANSLCRLLVPISLCYANICLAQQVATPTFTPNGGTYNLEQSVRVDCATAGATINYTTNGIDPTSSDRVVTSGSTVLVDHAITLKARATKTGLSPSAVKSAAFSITGQFAAGQNHSLIVKTDRTVWAWGANANGQLGRGSTSTSPLAYPGQVKTNSTTFLTNALTVAGGVSHSVAAKTDGTLWAWGSNASGQIGDGTTTQRLYATQVKLSGGAAFTGATDVVAGSDHCVALKSDGTVWAWGLNASGQVGNGTTTSPQKNPVQVRVNSSTFLTGVVAIAAGNTHSLALKSDGTVWAWGLNSSGQLGNTNTTNQNYAVQVKIAGGTAFTGAAAIAAGANHSSSRKTDGTLWTWGSNANGQLADGTTNPNSSSKQTNAVQVKASATSFFSDVSGIAGGGSHSMAIKTDGTLWSWGLNSSNQLGDGTSAQRVFPVQVKDTSGLFITGIVDVAGGASHSLATKSDGTAWGWGLNSLGQTGSSNTAINPNTATQIMMGPNALFIIAAMDDPDRDTLPTWRERELGTNPYSRDSDGDGIPDDYEVAHGLNPVVYDANGDLDGDGFTNAQEYAAGTNPQNRDTDGDGALDGEDIYPLDPYFSLKKQPVNTYAVVEAYSGGTGVEVKMNNLNTIIFNGSYHLGYVWKGGAPLALGFTAYGINDSDQIVGYKIYTYPPDYPGSPPAGFSELHHAVVNGIDVGDGTVDNGVNDTTGVPTIEGTNKACSEANAINNAGTVVGTSYFYVDVTPPQNPGDNSILTFGDPSSAQFGSGKPAAVKLGAPLNPSVINDSGDIAGASGLWSGGVFTSLIQFSRTYAINNDKYMVGVQWATNLGQDDWRPLIAHNGEVLIFPAPNRMRAEPFGMNKDGVAVGYCYTLSGDYLSMLWQNGTYYNLNNLLNSDAYAAGWTIGFAYAINDHGVIAAGGYRPGWGGVVLLIPEPAVQLVTPSGDPVNAPVDTAGDGQNEFTFDTSNPGVLSVHLKAKVLATGTAGSLASRCRFTIDPIEDSAMSWSSSNPGGQPTANGDFLEADATFTGLPTSNSGFGRKNVMITVDGLVKDQKAMEVFFPRDATNHQGGNSIDPNWFYYWKDGSVCGIDNNCVYDPSVQFGKTRPSVDTLMRLGPLVVLQANDGPIPFTSKIDGTTVSTTGNGQGIQCVAETIQHERHHLDFYNWYGVTIGQIDANNSDTDGIPDSSETNLDTVTTSSSDPDTFSVSTVPGFSGYASYGDNELRARIVELNLTIPLHPEADWSNPGCHSKNQWGPTP